MKFPLPGDSREDNGMRKHAICTGQKEALPEFLIMYRQGCSPLWLQ